MLIVRHKQSKVALTWTKNGEIARFANRQQAQNAIDKSCQHYEHDPAEFEIVPELNLIEITEEEKTDA